MFRYVGILLLLSCLFVLASCWPLSPDSLQHSQPTALLRSQQKPMIGGKTDLSHPAVGALTFLDSSFCSATLIAPRVVLTAAHCADFVQSALVVNTGVSWADAVFRIDLPSQDPKGFTSHRFSFAPEKIVWHPQWSSFGGNYPYDIALIVLQDKVPSSIATPIPFNADPLNNNDIGKEAMFLGYGVVQRVPLSVSAPSKQGAKIPITKLGLAEVTFGPSKDNVSVCFGDSGGPALMDYSGEIRVVAVNSHLSESSALPGSSGQNFSCDGGSVSVRTDFHKDFIQQILAEFGEGGIPCKKSSDCGFCGTCDDKQKCQPKPIDRFASTCKPCHSNKDCGLGVCRLLPEGFRCIQPCELDRCCPPGFSCSPVTPGGSVKLCQSVTGSCPKVACQDDKECGLAGQCVQGTCQLQLATRTATLCRPCQKHTDCGDSSNLCHLQGQTGVCLQACAFQEVCPAGFQCRALYAGFPKQCVPAYPASCTVSCQIDKDCPASWRCLEQVCRLGQPAQEGEACDEKTLCDRDFQCVRTIQGRRCLRPCGTPRGLAGSPCDLAGACQGKASCTKDENSSICLHTCTKDDDCKTSGGGRCYKGFCMCDEDKNCETGQVCNGSTGLLGACAAPSSPAACPDGRQCLYYNGSDFCMPSQTEVRGLGFRCDTFSPCATGFVCASTDGGDLCIEDCATSKLCRRGGSCQNFRGSQVCICTASDQCPTGHTCTIAFSRSRGLCKLTDLADCSSDLDCPGGLPCRDKLCLPPVSEPTSENPVSTESSLLESTSELASEVSNAPDAATSVIPDQSSPEVAADFVPELPPVPKGCGCQVSSGPIVPMWGWLLLLLLAVVARKRSIYPKIPRHSPASSV